jgi:hypothetical protein
MEKSMQTFIPDNVKSKTLEFHLKILKFGGKISIFGNASSFKNVDDKSRIGGSVEMKFCIRATYIQQSYVVYKISKFWPE